MQDMKTTLDDAGTPKCGTIPAISPHLVVAGELLSALDELNGAAGAHAAWLKQWHRALIYHLTPDPDDLREDAHHRCRLGQWYYGRHSPAIEAHPMFASLGEVHQDMHDCARQIGQAAARGESIPESAYERFMDAVLALSEQIRTLQYEILLMLAHSDPLTGIYNRLVSPRILEEERSRFERTGQPCCVVLVDLDHFKAINDTYGYLTGDRVSQVVAELQATHTRPYDHVFRYGGEEFLLCMPHTAPKAAECISERLRKWLEQTAIAADGSRELRVTASFGIACFAAGLSSEEVIERADRALYEAKRTGRNRVHTWSP